MVHKNELYIATVSIKQKAVDRIKTALQFWFNATQITARMTSKTTTFVTSISDILWSVTLTNRQTRKNDFTTKCTVRAAMSKVPSAE